MTSKDGDEEMDAPVGADRRRGDCLCDELVIAECLLGAV